jgi:hypothetical protein
MTETHGSTRISVAEVFSEYLGQENRIALRAYRTRENLTQKLLAALTGIPQHHISEMGTASAPSARSGHESWLSSCMWRIGGCL